MREKFYSFIKGIIITTLIALVALTPLIISNFFTDNFDIPKLIILVVSTLVLLGLWIFSWVLKGKVEITRTPLDIPLLLLLLAIIASTLFSTSKNASIYGILPEVHGSAVSWVTYILLYFVAASNLKKVEQIKIMLYAFLASASIISFVSLLSFFGVFLPLDFAQRYNFTLAGSSFSTISLLLILLPLPLYLSVNKSRFLPQPLAIIISVLFSLVIIITGSIPVYLILALVYLVTFSANLSKKSLPLLIIPILVSILILSLTHLSFPGNVINEARSNFPQEVQLPLNISWKVSATTFRDAPLLGTGPATYLYNFTSYKPAEFNLLSFWNFSFGTTYNEYLQILATLGILGFLALVLFSGVVVIYSIKYLFLRKLKETPNESEIFLPALALGGVVSMALFIIHSATLVSVVTMLFVLISFMMFQKHIQEKQLELSTGISIFALGDKKIDFLPILVFILFLIGAVPLSGKIFKVVAADYYHKLALSQASKDGTKTYEYLQKAENLNPAIDLYRIDMAQTNFALANALASQKGPTQDDSQGTLTDQDKQTIQTLITQAINEGRASVVLAPRSSRNWQVLALIYRNITGVADNSLAFALDAYGRAIQLDPLNPALRAEVGSVYYAAGNYELAIRFFSDAVNLKPDYVNGYYNLAVSYRENGDLENAKVIAERALALVQKDLGDSAQTTGIMKELKKQDYNTAIDLLKGIEEKIDTGNETDVESALQNPDLPNIDVPSLDSPPETSTPPEVGENTQVDISEPSPSVILTPSP